MFILPMRIQICRFLLLNIQKPEGSYNETLCCFHQIEKATLFQGPPFVLHLKVNFSPTSLRPSSLSLCLTCFFPNLLMAYNVLVFTP